MSNLCGYFQRLYSNTLTNTCTGLYFICKYKSLCNYELTHWSWEMHIYVSKLTIISSDNGLSPGRRQAIIWTNAGISLIGPLVTNLSEILIEFHSFSFKKMHLKMSGSIFLHLASNSETWMPGYHFSKALLSWIMCYRNFPFFVSTRSSVI